MSDVKNEPVLGKLIDDISSNKILLPDFQRGFVWTDEEKQKKLVASVLAKLPVGSLLLLTINPKDYAYKKIGCKNSVSLEEIGDSREPQALLDGQQRMTVLTNAFSDVIFRLAEKASELNSRSLQRRFFLRIPKYSDSESSMSPKDCFNALKLDFPWKNPDKAEPVFEAEDILASIEIISFKADQDVEFNPFKNRGIADLVRWCKDNYLIPLFLLTEESDTWRNRIVNGIAQNIYEAIDQRYEEACGISKEKKNEFVEQTLSEDMRQSIDSIQKIDDETFRNLLGEQRNNWAMHLLSYLKSCVDNLQLDKIIVDSKRRSRAISIYENLNMGGVPLVTFELVLARYASKYKGSYYEKIVKNIQKPYDYPEAAYSRYLANNEQIRGIIKDDSYNAGVALGCLVGSEEDIATQYKDAYLNVMSLYSYCPEYDVNKLDVSLIKREKQLNIDRDDLEGNCDKVCEALDLALFFLQMRCGITSIKDLNYKLVLTVVAYILLKKEFRDNQRIFDYLEAWYWLITFSGFFNTDQTDKAIGSIIALIKLLDNNERKWFEDRKKEVFNMQNFSDKEFLLIKNSKGGLYPKEFLRKTISQYFLAKTYKEFYVCEENSALLSPFYDGKLELHHVIPLGTFRYYNENIKKGDDDKKLRDDNSFFLNSPVNFIYISKGDNELISLDTPSNYIDNIRSGATASTLLLDRMEISGDASGDKDKLENACKQALEKRFDSIKSAVEKHLNSLLGF